MQATVQPARSILERFSLHLIRVCSTGREDWGQNQVIIAVRVLPRGSLQSLGQQLSP